MSTAVFIGRFQPPHLAHLETIRRALARHDRLVVVLGSAYSYPTPKNPFDVEARTAMLRASLEPALEPRVRFVAVPDDYYDDPRWFRAVRKAVEGVVGKEEKVCIVGYHKDESSYYLHGFGDWPFEPSGVRRELNATLVRERYFGGDEGWKAMVPEGVRAYLERFAQTPEFARLQAEWRALKHRRALERAYPYPILHLTVSALVRARDQVLLVERQSGLGQGAWALPEVHLGPKETLLTAALRALREKAGLGLSAERPTAWWAFDYPERSLRGRVVCYGCYFDLGFSAPPGLGAPQAFWLPLAELDRSQARFFEDHYQQICWFLGRPPQRPTPEEESA
ncbi:NUDIX domain-containing protein [Meiothermus sp. QL-1]|uniref:adenylyltransferase/cytidyltransferase family protein n=1 Tax=Meiothermus sp. QL-1 TaxID=2058095 RepID=UPI000E0A343F|nr:adenylyltransferase/cytidyltransferase family protein [Meiothermus sp. QL-1]RDI95329.1 NUDIX domain-containing protein [Meiothermus sp. QL-1]